MLIGCLKFPLGSVKCNNFDKLAILVTNVFKVYT